MNTSDGNVRVMFMETIYLRLQRPFIFWLILKRNLEMLTLVNIPNPKQWDLLSSVVFIETTKLLKLNSLHK